jgi:hypothetical protein
MFYVGHVEKISLYETLFHYNILSKHHHQVQVPMGSYIRSTGDRSYLNTSVALPASANTSISGVLVSSIPTILKVCNIDPFYLINMMKYT